MNAILRRSWLTLTVFAITATTSLLQVFVPGLLAVLERTPAIRDGEVWRIITSLLVQDGGWFGTVSNLLFLLAVGIAAELVLPRWLWLLCYLGGGVLGQLAGLLWQPVGAGNSVAVCGLAGALALTLIRGTNPSRWTAWIVTWWCAALAATISWTAFFLGVALAMVAQFAIIVLGRSGRPASERLSGHRIRGPRVCSSLDHAAQRSRPAATCRRGCRVDSVSGSSRGEKVPIWTRSTKQVPRPASLVVIATASTQRPHLRAQAS